MVRVANIMTRSVLTLSSTSTLEQAAQALTHLGVSGAPVCDAQGRVVGVFSKSDAIEPLSEDRWLTPRTVADVMSSTVCFARPNDSLREAIDSMVSQGVHRLIVVSETEELVGIVTPMDVLRAISAGTLTLHDA